MADDSDFDDPASPDHSEAESNAIPVVPKGRSTRLTVPVRSKPYDRELLDGEGEEASTPRKATDGPSKTKKTASFAPQVDCHTDTTKQQYSKLFSAVPKGIEKQTLERPGVKSSSSLVKGEDAAARRAELEKKKEGLMREIELNNKEIEKARRDIEDEREAGQDIAQAKGRQQRGALNRQKRPRQTSLEAEKNEQPRKAKKAARQTPVVEDPMVIDDDEENSDNEFAFNDDEAPQKPLGSAVRGPKPQSQSTRRRRSLAQNFQPSDQAKEAVVFKVKEDPNPDEYIICCTVPCKQCMLKMARDASWLCRKGRGGGTSCLGCQTAASKCESVLEGYEDERPLFRELGQMAIDAHNGKRIAHLAETITAIFDDDKPLTTKQAVQMLKDELQALKGKVAELEGRFDAMATENDKRCAEFDKLVGRLRASEDGVHPSSGLLPEDETIELLSSEADG
ncbi:hypothetical protein FDECE_9852 [Fusarium decemcellulare]|nr:hypothetical protein FDECE_9852 [Fusarium decemcellulare]